jgi:hypothetical protein
VADFESGFKTEVYAFLGPVCWQTIANLKWVLGRTLNCKLTLANPIDIPFQYTWNKKPSFLWKEFEYCCGK